MAVVRSLAVVGTGLIGASVGLAARRAGVETCRRLGSRPGAPRRGGRARRGRSRRRSRGSPRRRGARRRRGTGHRAAGAGARGARRERRRTARSPTSARRRAACARRRRASRGSSAGIRSAAPRRAGRSGRRPSCSTGATWFLTPVAATDPDSYKVLHGFVSALGAVPVAIDPEAHDRLVAVTSHLPHALANVLLNQAGRRPRRRARAARGGGRLAARHDAGRRREPAHLGRHLPREP